MVSVATLWLPIVVSALFVFLASSVIHMMLPWHRNDYRRLPAEDEVMEALRKFDIPPGDYMMPCAGSPKAMSSPGFLEKMTKGPVAAMTVMAPGLPNMGKSLLQWFIYCLVVGLLTGYLAGLAFAPGAPYRAVFRFVSCAAFIGYSVAGWQQSIWMKRGWGTTFRMTIDGLVYGLLTGGVFGWLWP